MKQSRKKYVDRKFSIIMITLVGPIVLTALEHWLLGIITSIVFWVCFLRMPEYQLCRIQVKNFSAYIITFVTVNYILLLAIYINVDSFDPRSVGALFLLFYGLVVGNVFIFGRVKKVLGQYYDSVIKV